MNDEAWLNLKTPPPFVGQFFWQLRAGRSGPRPNHFVKHEVRVVDERDQIVVHRRWTPYKQIWIYEVEEIWLWRHGGDIGRNLPSREEAKRWARENWGSDKGAVL